MHDRFLTPDDQRQHHEAQRLVEQFPLIRRLDSQTRAPGDDYYERDGKQYKMADASDIDPRGRAYVSPNDLFNEVCVYCGARPCTT